MADTATALDLSCFAYLALQRVEKEEPRLVSTYPSAMDGPFFTGTAIKPSIPSSKRRFRPPNPFDGGIDLQAKSTSMAQQQLFDEAAEFGIRIGFTVPIHQGTVESPH